jgi:hypothetical protein
MLAGVEFAGEVTGDDGSTSLHFVPEAGDADWLQI